MKDKCNKVFCWVIAAFIIIVGVVAITSVSNRRLSGTYSERSEREAIYIKSINKDTVNSLTRSGEFAIFPKPSSTVVQDSLRGVEHAPSTGLSTVASPGAVGLKHYFMNTDIVVYGGGAGGVMTAYQAALLGKHVILIEPTEWLGGQASAAGVGAIDAGVLPEDMQFGAIARWLNIVKQIYRERGLPEDQIYAGCHWNWEELDGRHACPDPYIANLAFKRLLTDSRVRGKVHVLYNTDIYNNTPLLKDTTGKVTGIKVRRDNTYYAIRAKVVVDASEYGDLIPNSGAAFIIRWGPWFHNRAQAVAWAQAYQNEEQTRIQDINAIADLRLVNSFLPYGIKQLYQYKIKDRYPQFYPAGEELDFFEGQVITGEEQDKCTYELDEEDLPWGFYFHARYRALADPYISHQSIGHVGCRDRNGYSYREVTKFGLNMANDYSVHALFLLDRNTRRQRICQAKEFTLKYASYLEELPLPQGVANNWYLARENHTCDSYGCYILARANCSNIPDALERNMYLIPYVRESIRPAGLINTNTNNPVLWWSQVVRFNYTVKGVPAMKPDSVSVGVYGFDLHDSSDVVSDVVPDKARRAGYYQLPLGVFIPTDGQQGHPHVIKGFLVAEKNLAVDRYVQGSIRVHVSVMLNGITAGVLASLAADYNGDTSQLKAPVVQELITSPEVRGKISPYLYQEIDYTHYSPEYKYSELLSTLGIFVGDGSHPFRSHWHPHHLLTRAELAAVLRRVGLRIGIDLARHKIREYHNNFIDIDHLWAKQQVIQLYEAGLTNGCTVNKFCPGRTVTLNEEVAFFYRLLKLNPNTLTPRVNCQDIELPRAVTNWVKPAYITLIKAGVLEPRRYSGGICRVNYLVEKCGSDYFDCTVPGKPMDRMDTGRLMWEMYKALSK